MAAHFDVSNVKEGIGRALRGASTHIVEQAGSVKQTAKDARGAAKDRIEKLAAKAADPYEEVIAEYNAAFTAMSDKGGSFLHQRERSADLIELVELLVNSIANPPKSFEASLGETGALVAGGGGTAAGGALLALAGPVGWTGAARSTRQ